MGLNTAALQGILKSDSSFDMKEVGGGLCLNLLRLMRSHMNDYD